MSLSLLHRCGAGVLGLFILAHLGVHLTALGGVEAHTNVLGFVQQAYRHPVAEAMLVLIILSQIVSGLIKVRRNGIGTGWARAQAISGFYLGFFLLIHTGAALNAHWIYGLETDFYWAAGSLHFDPIRFAFAVYYALAVTAIFTHLGAALHYAGPAKIKPLSRLAPVMGAMLGIAIVATFWGAFYEIDLPRDVADYYESNFGFLGVEADSPD